MDAEVRSFARLFDHSIIRPEATRAFQVLPTEEKLVFAEYVPGLAASI